MNLWEFLFQDVLQAGCPFRHPNKNVKAVEWDAVFYAQTMITAAVMCYSTFFGKTMSE